MPGRAQGQSQLARVNCNAVRDLAFRQGAIVQARDQFCRVRADIFQKGHRMCGPGQSLRRRGIGPDDLACCTINKRRRWGGAVKRADHCQIAPKALPYMPLPRCKQADRT